MANKALSVVIGMAIGIIPGVVIAVFSLSLFSSGPNHSIPWYFWCIVASSMAVWSVLVLRVRRTDK